MANEIDSRSLSLLGEESMKKIHLSSVAVFGLGGVGGTAFEALVRAGIGTIYAIDKDVVERSNLNRQILYVEQDIGKWKCDCALSLANRIRKDVKVVPEGYLVGEKSLSEHDYSSCSYLLDCLDDVAAKISLIKYSMKEKIPLLVSLGMGNRLDPSALYVTTLGKTEGDPLAKKLRNELRKEGIDLSKVACVLSKEEPLVKLPHPASLMMVPSAAGLLMASRIISFLR